MSECLLVLATNNDNTHRTQLQAGCRVGLLFYQVGLARVDKRLVVVGADTDTHGEWFELHVGVGHQEV